MKNQWFTVDTKGLAQLQAGRPKWHIARELVQNSFDESVTKVALKISGENGVMQLSVEDDSPEGFRDLADAFTLFGETYKRSDPTKRGRFNLGEKQAIAQARYAKIETTKGTVIFDGSGRKRSFYKREAGSEVTVEIRANRSERETTIAKAKRFIAPAGVTYTINGEQVIGPKVVKTFEAHLLRTVILKDEMMQDDYRSCQVHVYEADKEGAWLYELGIPVCSIQCKWSLDVQQKVPLAMDRETVRDSYLSDLYAQVLNQMVEQVEPEEISTTWVRLGAEHHEIKAETTAAIVQKRWGDKVAIATPNDARANDEAIANGFKVVHGAELSSNEWSRIRESNAIQSTTALFGLKPGVGETVAPTHSMLRVAALAKRIAHRVDGYELAVDFIKQPQSAGMAWFGNRKLTFVVDLLPADFFDNPKSAKVIDVIIHELGHEHGTHTERGYLDALTRIGGELVNVALTEPQFFDL